MWDKIKRYVKNGFSSIGIAFGIIGALSPFVSLDEIIITVKGRIVLLVVVALGALVVSIIITYRTVCKKSKEVYAKGKTTITFEYADINNIIAKADTSNEMITVVVPINTDIDSSFDRNIIKKQTVHRLCLDYIISKTKIEPDKSLLDKVVKKKDGFDHSGKMGDWFLIKPNELDIEGNTQFLFVEIYNLEKKHGALSNAEMTKKDFLVALQLLIEAITEALDNEDKVYVPLVGAGAGGVGTPSDIMHFMNAMLRFNKSILRQDIHVVIKEKEKQEDTIPIYKLSKYSTF